MFLQPNEVGFLSHLKEARIPLVEFEIPAKKISNIQSQLEQLIGKNYFLNNVRSPPFPIPSSLPIYIHITNDFSVRARRLQVLPASLRLALAAQRV